MKRSQLEEFHYITHIDNLSSILDRGILSHARSQVLKPTSIASQDVQDRRELKGVPRGRRLHEYANLYFTARNPMMYVVKDKHNDLVVLRVKKGVLDIPNAVIADGNAASDPTAFYSSPDGLQHLDDEAMFAEFWTDQDFFQYWYKKRVKGAEVLIPDRIDPGFITGAYVSSQQTLERVNSLNLRLQVTVSGSLFFRT